MLLDEIKLEVGKSYPIDYVIKEIEKAPDIRLGHIVVSVLYEHVYHADKLKLEELSKKIKRIIAERGKEYERIGKKFIATDSITILAIDDPYTKYQKYTGFYVSIEPQIVKGIEDSVRGQIAAPIEAIIEEAKKAGFVIEDIEEFFNGMGIFFRRKGITTKPISGKEYILFEKIDKIRPSASKNILSEIEAAEKEYEKYATYTKFYESFFEQIAKGIVESKKGEIAAPIKAIIEEGKKLDYIALGKDDDFLRGMGLYFKVRGIDIEKTPDRTHVIFRKRG